MKRNFFVAVIWGVLGLALPDSLPAKSIYVAQTSLGAASGQDAADAYPLTWLNSSANWGSGTSQFNPGDTVYLVGTITQQVVVAKSGNPGQPYTIAFYPGANLTSPAWSTTGAINIGANSWVTVDGMGVGVIRNTNNGTSLGLQQASYGIYAYNGTANGITIRNLTINNIYVNVAGAEGGSGIGMYIGTSGTNIAVYGCNITNAETGVALLYGGMTAQNFQVYSNSIYGCNHSVTVGSANCAFCMTGIYIHHNLIDGNYLWDESADNYHHNGIFVYGGCGDNYLTNIYIYNNKIGPMIGVNNTGHIFVDMQTALGAINVFVYNNVLWTTNGAVDAPKNGFIVAGGMNCYIFNNSIEGGNAYGNGIMTGGSNVFLLNNIVRDCSIPVWLNSGTAVTACNSNIYSYKSLNPVWLGSQISFAQWQAKGLDTRSSTNDPRFMNISIGDLRLQSNSPAIGAGMNLSGYFATDFSGNARPTTGAWDIGACQYASSVLQEPVISNLQYSSGTNTATITWTTDVSANSIVNYGPTSAYGMSVTNTAMGLSHSVTLANLAPATFYNYQVQSMDSSNRLNASANQILATTVTGLRVLSSP